MTKYIIAIIILFVVLLFVIKEAYKYGEKYVFYKSEYSRLQLQNDSLRIANYNLQEKLMPKPRLRVYGILKPGHYID